ncbi:MAG: glycerol-3-phosphate dehydrogenase/oxidase, partial [Verrucomicrobia bacterium]|nr:glycerol-3-phosphate dehydrogenase/oxidase [Verrucomicrobiota bacterium]
MPLEVLVIGGGIVGAGMARDAAMRGLRVGLVEQRDFASGTSSRSSRLLHGGLRYLAQGRIALVREASVEKKIISRIAPHLAEPLPFLFPAYRGNKTWGLRRLQIGVKAYDLLCGGRNLGKSTWLNRAETLQRVPDLSADGLTGAIRYYDGFTNDARLVLDTLRSAAKHGAILLNYCKFEDADFHSGRWHCRICDGAGQAPGPSIVQARAVVNACGPWAGGLPHGRVKLRLTKGIHLVVNRSRLAVPEAVVMTEGKRILFVIPWGERIILGTTDTDYDGPLDHVRADGPEIRYILEITNRHFPKAKLGVCDVISSWAGLRPLIAGPDGNPSEISRRHEIRNPEPGWWDVAGGKLTSYRLMAEQALDQIIKSLNPARDSDRKIAPCRTADEPLLPRTETEGVSGILPPQSSRDTVNHHCANEWALHLDDVMVRRTGWHYYFADAAERAGPVADWMG